LVIATYQKIGDITKIISVIHSPFQIWPPRSHIQTGLSGSQRHIIILAV